MTCYTRVLETHLTICVPCMDETKLVKASLPKPTSSQGHVMSLVMSWS